MRRRRVTTDGEISVNLVIFFISGPRGYGRHGTRLASFSFGKNRTTLENAEVAQEYQLGKIAPQSGVYPITHDPVRDPSRFERCQGVRMLLRRIE